MESEDYLKALEKYIGVAYPWKIFQFVVTPPSFPYLGMENPLLTLISPSIFTESNALFNVYINEMAHSWVGNLVTCSDWTHSWLIEVQLNCN